MSKEKLETGAMLNPDCQKCPKKDKCNNKTLCAYLIPKDMHINKTTVDIQVPIIFTPEILQDCRRSSMRGMR